MKRIISTLLILVLAVCAFCTHAEVVPTPTSTPIPKPTVKVGDIVTFGSYEQDNDPTNGKEPIEWEVLNVDSDGICLLISKYALDCESYNAAQKDVTWETCSLRNWLNGSFYNATFNAIERDKIVLTKNQNADNSIHGTDGGNDTNDYVFLLSLEEIEKYYNIDKSTENEWYWNGENRLLKTPTEYTKAQGAGWSVYNGACVWWLRSSGCASNCAASVHTDGSLSIAGGYVDNSGYSIVPALRVMLF